MSTGPTNPALTQPTMTTTTTATPTVWGGLLTIVAALGGIFGLLIHFAAAKLSYDKYQSWPWAILDFFFAFIYIPYYAFLLNTPTSSSTFGGRARRR